MQQLLPLEGGVGSAAGGCRGEKNMQPVAAARRRATVVLMGCRWTVRERGVREREKRKERMGVTANLEHLGFYGFLSLLLLLLSLLLLL